MASMQTGSQPVNRLIDRALDLGLNVQVKNLSDDAIEQYTVTVKRHPRPVHNALDQALNADQLHVLATRGKLRKGRFKTRVTRRGLLTESRPVTLKVAPYAIDQLASE